MQFWSIVFVGDSLLQVNRNYRRQGSRCVIEWRLWSRVENLIPRTIQPPARIFAMDKERAWKGVERTSQVSGAVFTAIGAYYAAATYYGWNGPSAVQSPAPSPSAGGLTMPSLWWWLIIAVGIVLIVTGWAMMIARRRERRRQTIRESGPSVAPAKPIGFEFFPDRDSLTTHGSLGKRLANSSKVDAIWTVGIKFYDEGENLHVVKRLLLPNPSGEAIKYLTGTVEREKSTEYIVEATRKAKANDARVRWYDNFSFHSVMLVDTDQPTGWMHIESVFP
jgi:hypothetical protein